MFRKAKQNRIFQDVVEQIQDAILDGELKSGEKLSSERELAELFGTSRGTMREALRVLEQKGLVEIRLGVGGGAVVKDASADLISDSLALLIRSQKVSLAHLAEFREGVEGMVTGLAAKRATEKDIHHLRELLDQARVEYESGIDHWNTFVRIDETLHMTFSRIAGNPIFIFILQTIHDNIHRYYDRFLTIGTNEFRENYEDLRHIVDAIAAHDPTAARRLARGHVRRFNARMEKKKRQIGS